MLASQMSIHLLKHLVSNKCPCKLIVIRLRFLFIPFLNPGLCSFNSSFKFSWYVAIFSLIARSSAIYEYWGVSSPLQQIIALYISIGKSSFYSRKGLLMSELATLVTNWYNCSPKWLLASFGISAGKWSTLWNNIQLLFA